MIFSRSLLLTCFFLLEATVSSAATSQEPTFKVGMYTLSEDIDSVVAYTVSDYVVLNHLSRSLVTFYLYGELQGDIADSWRIEDDFKRYVFYIKKNERFSDGSKITANDVAESLRRTLKAKGVVHYDIAKIASIEVINSETVAVNLNRKDPFFLYDLGNPEFGILSPKDQKAKPHQQTFSVTSGPYTVTGREKGKFTFAENLFFPFKSQHPKHLEVSKISESEKKVLETGKLKNIPYDIFWATSVDLDVHKKFIEEKLQVLTPRLGFTFWISINPNSRKMGKIENRQVVQGILNPKDLLPSAGDPFHSPAYQLYFPNGPGRIENKFVEDFWIKARSQLSKKPADLKSITLLCAKNFLLEKKVVGELQKSGISVAVKHYENFVDYEKLIAQAEDYDLIQVNNDFSDLDLRGNINLTFNPHRPLMMLPEKDHGTRDLIKSISLSLDETQRNTLIRELGIRLLENGYYVPQFYLNTVLYMRPEHEISEWSQIGFDISFWKIHPWKK